ncbi:MAG: hypothetical protein QM730_11770 [Anaerolineales bacterium]
MTKYDLEITRLIGFLPLNGDNPDVQKVIERYRPGVAVQEQLHFHVGRVGRFRESFTAQQQAILREKLAAYLPRMGYEA